MYLLCSAVFRNREVFYPDLLVRLFETGSHYEVEAGLEHSIFHLSAPQVLGTNVCATTAG